MSAHGTSFSAPNSDPNGIQEVNVFMLGAWHPDDIAMVSISPENNNVLRGDDFMFGLELWEIGRNRSNETCSGDVREPMP